MNGFLVFCENPGCGAIFVSKLFSGTGSVNIQMTNSRVGPCPVCGSMGIIPDGTYNYANEAIQFLTGPHSSKEKLLIVEQILKTSLLNSYSREDVIKEINSKIPEFAKWFEDYLPAIKNSATWIAIVIALISLAIQIHTSYFKDNDIKDIFIEHLLEDQKKIDELQKPSYKSLTPIPLDSPCPCGSGKEYIRCCGKKIDHEKC